MPEPDALQAFKAICIAIIDRCGTKAQWSWDDRFGAAVVQIKINKAPPVEEALVEAFASTAWVPETLSDAPAKVQEIADAFGGLDATQKLFVSNPGAPSQLIVAWWPWRDGKNLSLRFMLQAESVSTDETTAALRSWFDL
jgi:hypothetical protein